MVISEALLIFSWIAVQTLPMQPPASRQQISSARHPRDDEFLFLELSGEGGSPLSTPAIAIVSQHGYIVIEPGLPDEEGRRLGLVTKVGSTSLGHDFRSDPSIGERLRIRGWYFETSIQNGKRFADFLESICAGQHLLLPTGIELSAPAKEQFEKYGRLPNDLLIKFWIVQTMWMLLPVTFGRYWWMPPAGENGHDYFSSIAFTATNYVASISFAVALTILIYDERPQTFKTEKEQHLFNAGVGLIVPVACAFGLRYLAGAF